MTETSLGRDGFEYEYLACLTPAIAARVERGGDRRIRAEPHGDVVVKVVLLALGSRGDVQPMVALGKALQAVGKPVTVVALRNFAPLVEEAGLSFVPVEREWTDESTQAAIVKSREKSFNRAVRAWLTDIAPQVTAAEMAAVEPGDLVVAGLMSIDDAVALQEARGCLAVSVLMAPILPTASGPSTAFAIRPQDNSVLNRWAGRAASLPPPRCSPRPEATCVTS